MRNGSCRAEIFKIRKFALIKRKIFHACTHMMENQASCCKINVYMHNFVWCQDMRRGIITLHTIFF